MNTAAWKLHNDLGGVCPQLSKRKESATIFFDTHNSHYVEKSKILAFKSQMIKQQKMYGIAQKSGSYMLSGRLGVIFERVFLLEVNFNRYWEAWKVRQEKSLHVFDFLNVSCLFETHSRYMMLNGGSSAEMFVL